MQLCRTIYYCRLIEVDLSTLEDQTRCAVCLGAGFSFHPNNLKFLWMCS